MSPAILRSIPLLRCPHTDQPLELLSAPRIAQLNQDMKQGRWGHADPATPPAPLNHGVGTPAGDIVYRIEDDIICLLPQLAIRLRSTHSPVSELSSELKIVQSFYNEFGWVKNSTGLFNDTTTFSETRHCARRYQLRCNERILALLDRGEYLLDVASGAIPHPEYRDHSRRYRTRICVDFSIRALREARAQIGDHGLYILGDITHLPLASSAIDAVISLHTLYHLPPDAQIRACDELLRVARPQSPVIVVYVWSHSPLMSGIEYIRRLPRLARRLFHRVCSRSTAEPILPASSSSTPPALYFHPCDYAWFSSRIATRHPATLRVWSSVTMEFQTRFFTDDARGRMISSLVMGLEDALPCWCGRAGHYPIWRFTKPGAS